MTRGFSRLLLLGSFLGAAACGPEATTSSSDQLYEGSHMVLEDAGHGPSLCYAVNASDPPQCDGLRIIGWDWSAVEGETRALRTIYGSWHVVGTYDGETFTLAERPGAARTSAATAADPDFSPACEQPSVVVANHGVNEWEQFGERGTFPEADLVSLWVSDPAGPWDGPFVVSVMVRPGAKERAESLVREIYNGALCVIEHDGPTAAQLRDVQDQASDEESVGAIGVAQGASANERPGFVDVTVAFEQASS